MSRGDNLQAKCVAMDTPNPLFPAPRPRPLLPDSGMKSGLNPEVLFFQ